MQSENNIVRILMTTYNYVMNYTIIPLLFITVAGTCVAVSAPAKCTVSTHTGRQVHRFVLTYSCDPGYTPSATTQKCSSGVWTPQRVTRMGKYKRLCMVISERVMDVSPDNIIQCNEKLFMDCGIHCSYPLFDQATQKYHWFEDRILETNDIFQMVID